MKKKVLSLALILMLICAMFVLTGCGTNEGENSESAEGSNEESKINPNDYLYSYMDSETELYGYKNADNEIVIEAQFNKANEFVNGVAKVATNNGTGYINTSGEFIIEAKWNWTNSNDPNGEYIIVGTSAGSGGSYANYYLFDYNGEQITKDSHYEKMVYPGKNGLVFVKYYNEDNEQGNRLWYGYINFDEEVVLTEDSWDSIGTAFCDAGYAFVGSFNNCLINEQGEKVTSAFPFVETYNLNKEGYFIAKSEETSLYGVSDCNGNFVIEPTYESGNIAKLSDNNLVFASEDGEKFGIIDITTGEWVTEQKFDDIITYFTEYGFCLVRVDEKYGIINENGEYVVEPDYTGYTTFEDGYWYLSNDEERILVTETGEIGATTKY